jgi:hypothetical protein
MSKIILAHGIGLWGLSQPRWVFSVPSKGQREDWQGRGKRPKPKIR